MQDIQTIEERIIEALQNFAHSLNSSHKSVGDMSSLIEVSSEISLKNFEYWERLIRSEYSLALQKTIPTKWQFWSKPREFLTWLDLISWNGYKREEALLNISGAAPNAFFYSLVVRRLNDWVLQVREAAKKKLPEITRATNLSFVVEALSVTFSNWNSWGRIEDEDKQILLQIICEERIADLLRMKLVSSSSGPMPSLFSQLGRTSILDGKVEEIATCAIQPALRAKAFRSLFEGRISWLERWKWEWTDVRYCQGRLKPIVSERKINVQLSFPELLKISSKDRSSKVRSVSAEFLIHDIEKLGAEAKKYADEFASDKSFAVSERGRFALKLLEEKEFKHLNGKSEN